MTQTDGLASFFSSIILSFSSAVGRRVRLVGRRLSPFVGVVLALVGLITPIVLVGATGNRASAAPIFRLPWQGGVKMVVLQGQSQGSHVGAFSQFAYDFAPQISGDHPFTVRAARAGRVIDVKQDFPVSADCQPSLSRQGNYVIIDHGDGLGSLYMHLAPKSVPVPVGANVREGDVLGLTGKTGFVCGSPHLHFTVMELPSQRSVDVPFVDADVASVGGHPQTGQWLVSGNSVTSYTVTLPIMSRRGAPGRTVLTPTPPVATPTSPVATPTPPIATPTPVHTPIATATPFPTPSGGGGVAP